MTEINEVLIRKPVMGEAAEWWSCELDDKLEEKDSSKNHLDWIEDKIVEALLLEELEDGDERRKVA